MLYQLVRDYLRPYKREISYVIGLQLVATIASGARTGSICW